MKKIIVGIFSFILLFAAQNVLASTWNGDSKDCKSISIVNATTNEGYAHPCWPSSSVSADAGDTLNIRVYYHNTGTATANNTTITLNAPTGGSASTSKSFSGNISSDKGGLSLGSVTAKLSSSQTITFNNVKWYTNNTSETLTALPGGQSGSEILSGGLNLGSIAPGWATQGSLVVSFHVSNTTPPVENCTISNFNSNPSTINNGNSSTLSWTTSDCISATIYPTIGTISPNSGTQAVSPVASTTYTLTAYGANGNSQTKTATVNVIDNQFRCLDSSASNYLAYNSCIYSITRCLDTSASNYLAYKPCVYNQVRCLDSSANNYRSYERCTYDRTRCLDTSASNYLAHNSCIYNQTRCLDTSASNYLAYNSCIYNQTRCLDTSASNYLAYNSCVYNNTTTYVNKNVVTTIATNITSNQAQINGYITNSTFYNSNIYFNYGTTVNLGSRTTSKTTSGNSYFSDFISGLNPNTIYFFQAVGENSTGVSKGNIEVFKTLGNGIIQPIVIQGTTIINSKSPVFLSITNKYELIGAGDLVDYIIIYKNIGNTKLLKPMIQVMLPTNITLINASRGTYSVDTHTLSALIEDLEKGEEGIIYIQAKVDSIPLNNAQIVTTAILVYTNENNLQENVMAYEFNVPKQIGIMSTVIEENNLGANAFFVGFMSIGLVGWLLIILLILLIILIARSYSRNNISTDSKTTTHTITH